MLSTNSGAANVIFVHSDKLIFNPFDGTLTSINFNSASDQNLKYNIKNIESPIEKINQLRGITFNWKDTNNPSMGVLAQDVEKIFPELVFTANNKKTVNYSGLIAVLIECVKELNLKVEKNNK